MKTKRFLLILLVLALVLAAPIATHADPPDDQCPSPFSSDGHHSYSQSRQEATCTDAGAITWVCSDCGKVYTETIPALGHDWTAWQTRQGAICTAGGTEYRQCSRCGAFETRNTDPLGHAWDNGSVTTAATCTAEGVKTFTCIRCKVTRTDAIPKTNHTPVSVPGKAATCTEAGLTEGSKCSVCGTVLTAQQSIPAKGHTPSTVAGKAATCTESGLTEGSKCSTCGTVLKAQETIAAKGHSWDGGRVTQEATCTAEGVKTFTCANCGATRTDTFPAKGHTPTTVAGKAATCNEAGLTEGSQCSACGAILKAQETIPAKGHAWDQGVITTEPQGLTPGVKTYTCQNDHDHTYTEPVDPTQSLFWGMRSGGVPEFNASDTGVSFEDFMNGENLPLVIIQQPEGGTVPHDKSDKLVLTVAATGGEGAYTYEWFYQHELPTMTTFPVFDLVFQQAADFNTTVSAAKGKTDTAAAQALQSWHQSHGILLGTVDKTTTATQAETMTAQPLQQSYNPLAQNMGSSSTPECNAWYPGSYWCVVHDEAGHTATSEKAQVTEGLYIAVQPQNTNIYGLDAVTLTCVAAGGSGDNLYTWYDDEDTPISNDPSFSVSKLGQYRCLVVDYITMEMAESQTVQVYSEKRDLSPIITLQPESIELEYREDGQYSWSLTCLAQTFDGGTENLKYVWMEKVELGWAPIKMEETLARSNELGTFQCTVFDERNNWYTLSNEVTVSVPMKCTVAKTEIIDSDYVYFVFSFSGGASPFTVDVYQIWYSNIDGMEPVEVLYHHYITDSVEEIRKIWPWRHEIFVYEDGVPKLYTERLAYYVVVTDGTGATERSATVMW